WRNEVVIYDHFLLHRRHESLLNVTVLGHAGEVVQLAWVCIEVVELQDWPRTTKIGSLMLGLELTRLVSGEHLLPSRVGPAVHGPILHLRSDIVYQLPALAAYRAGQVEGGRFRFRPEIAVPMMQTGAEDVFAGLILPSSQKGKEAAAGDTLRHRRAAGVH